MAARIEPAARAAAPGDLVDLRQLSARELETVLDEETCAWAATLEWDFRKSADLVRRFVNLRALEGQALVRSGEVIGYSYFVVEENKALIGDLYVREQYRNIETENCLLEAVLHSLVGASRVQRIEAQLMMIASDPERLTPGADFLSRYDRNFMMLDLAACPPLPAAALRRDVHVEKWAERHHEPSAQLIASAYVDHIDNQINDQYRSLAGARRFLHNIVQYPGCGTFFRPASFTAFDVATEKICGLSLTSLVARDIGHITQVCVSPALRGLGIGYELLRQSLEALRARDCRKVSLTVTSANHEAVRVYEHMGFATVRKFAAYAWEGF